MNSMAKTPKLDNLLCFSLYSTSLAMNKVYRAQLKPLNITYSQYLVLVVLWQQKEVSVSEIGEQLFLDSATLTPLLKRMEKADLVIRRRAPEDERHVLITLGSEGIKLEEHSADLFESVGCALGVSEQGAKEIKQALEVIRSNLLHSC